MLTGIDHLVIACPDPDAAADALERQLGLRFGSGGRHDRLGTFNRLIWLGESYLELIGVFDRALAIASWVGAPALAALEAGGGLATWAVASDAIDADIAALRQAGSPLADPIAGERRRIDGSLVRWRLSAPPTLGPARAPFLIEHDPSGAEWTPAERRARDAEVHPLGGPVRLDVLELPVPDVRRATAELFRTAGIGPFRPSLTGRGSRDASVGRQTVRLRPEAGLTAAPVWPVATIRLRTIRLPAAGTAPAAPSSDGPAGRSAELLGCRFVVASG